MCLCMYTSNHALSFCILFSYMYTTSACNIHAFIQVFKDIYTLCPLFHFCEHSHRNANVDSSTQTHMCTNKLSRRIPVPTSSAAYGRARALYRYVPTREDELPLKKHDYVMILGPAPVSG